MHCFPGYLTGFNSLLTLPGLPFPTSLDAKKPQQSRGLLGAIATFNSPPILKNGYTFAEPQKQSFMLIFLSKRRVLSASVQCGNVRGAITDGRPSLALLWLVV